MKISTILLLFLFIILCLRPTPRLEQVEPPFNCQGEKVGELREGMWTCWFSNGQKSSEIYYKDGKREGLSRHWHNDGALDFEAQWSHGQFEGESVQYYHNGNIKEQTSFKKGQIDGIARYYNESGDLERRAEFEKGRLVAADFGKQEIGKRHQQIVIVHGKLDSITATLEVRTYDKGEKLVFGPVPAVVGVNGLAELGKKREGDGKTPQGLFPIESAFGAVKKIATKLDYKQVTAKDKWIDDVNSRDYNKWITGDTKAKSFEVLLRKDDLYKYALILGYNRKPIKKGFGSAIFAHVWRNSQAGTAGCVAIAENDMKALLALLDQKLNPGIWITTD